MRNSYEDELGQEAAPLGCSGCGKRTPAWALYRGEHDEPEGWICGGCIEDARRLADAQREQAARLPASDWASDYGVYLKAQRVTLLDQWRWAIMPDSPLGQAAQAAFMAYLTALNRMTVDCASPSDWVWPLVPEPTYD